MQTDNQAAPFIHRPRQAIVSHINGQRGARTFGAAIHATPIFGTSTATISVQRPAHSDAAALGFEVANASITFGALLSPSNLRAIAAQLIDAAHDIEAHPAGTIPLTLQDQPGAAA